MRRADRERAAQVLRTADWLAGYPLELAAALLAEGRLVRLPRGAWAQAEGDERSGLFILIDGTLHVYCTAPGDREVLIGHSEAGAVIGHATRFGGGPRLVTAVCAQPCMLLEVSESALERVAARQPEMWQAIAGFAYENMRRAVRMSAEVIALPPRQRLASRLLLAAGPASSLRLSQAALAEMIGVARKTVNQHLVAFRREGLIEIGYGRIVLHDREGLQRIAES